MERSLKISLPVGFPTWGPFSIVSVAVGSEVSGTDSLRHVTAAGRIMEFSRELAKKVPDLLRYLPQYASVPDIITSSSAGETSLKKRSRTHGSLTTEFGVIPLPCVCGATARALLFFAFSTVLSRCIVSSSPGFTLQK